MQIPGIPFFLTYGALRQYLQGREHMRPALWVILAANVFNALFNWVFIFGNLGVPALGLMGAGIATSLTRFVACLGLIAWTIGFRLHEDAWVPWGREPFRLWNLRRVAALGLPVGVQMALEIWAFAGAALLAGLLGTVPLAAHTIALNMAALSFMVPLGISQGAATRVGNLIGARDPDGAQRAAWVSLAMGAGVMTVAAVVLVFARFWLPRVYTPDAAVIAACAAILPIAAAFRSSTAPRWSAAGSFAAWDAPAPPCSSTSSATGSWASRSAPGWDCARAGGSPGSGSGWRSASAWWRPCWSPSSATGAPPSTGTG